MSWAVRWSFRNTCTPSRPSAGDDLSQTAPRSGAASEDIVVFFNELMVKVRVTESLLLDEADRLRERWATEAERLDASRVSIIHDVDQALIRVADDAYSRIRARRPASSLNAPTQSGRKLLLRRSRQTFRYREHGNFIEEQAGLANKASNASPKSASPTDSIAGRPQFRAASDTSCIVPRPATHAVAGPSQLEAARRYPIRGIIQ